MASVLVVSMPDFSQRILKLFSPDYKDVFYAELTAYCALAHHGISVPPTTAGKRVVPYCYGSLRLRSLEQLDLSTPWDSPMGMAKLPLCGLLLEFIPNATSIAADPARLAQKPHLVDDLLAALRLVHSAGVVHYDTMPRNMMLDDKDGVWWIDFGSASTTGFYCIHPRVFPAELNGVEQLLRDDVIPSELEGRTPEWHIIGC
jgi:serine/threonine protein kinase